MCGYLPGTLDHGRRFIHEINSGRVDRTDSTFRASRLTVEILDRKEKAMADQTTIHIAENSAEHVAYRLMILIHDVEGKSGSMARHETRTREEILSTYAECLLVVTGKRP